MTYIYSDKSTANTLALHHFDAQGLDYEKFFYFAERWLCDHGFEPNRIGGARSTITFSRGKKNLEKSNFKRIREEGFWIACLPPEDQIDVEMFDYKASIYISGAYDEYRRNKIYISWDDPLLSWNNEIFLSLLKDIYNLLQPAYGYAFQRSFLKGPGTYTVGAITGLKYEDPENNEITRWGVIGAGTHSLYQPHFIRDVYPLNFLSPQHLEGPVGGQTLRQWIESDHVRGTLAPVVGDLTAWTVDPAHIPALREELRPHNILICFMDY